MNERLVRYYVQEGVLERPERAGREAVFGFRQLLELVAARQLADDGWPLAKIASWNRGADEKALLDLIDNEQRTAPGLMATALNQGFPETHRLVLAVNDDPQADRDLYECWHPRYMDYLAPHLSADRRLDAQLMIPVCREPEDEREKDSPEPTIFKAVEALVKGIEIPLPPPHTFKDKDGHERSRVRVRWWDTEAVTYSQAAMLLDEEREALPNLPIPEHVRLGHDGEKPLFVGHYWLSGTPRLLSSKVACVDYSIAKGGKLVAYRWDGESVLDESKFHWVRA